jgi:hypothetical protein
MNISGSMIVRNFLHKNTDWTSEKCISEMNITREELESYQVMGTFFGLALNNPKALDLHHEWVTWCRVEGVIKGSRESHRHDQTVLSILAKRFDIELLEPESYMKIGRKHSDYEEAKNMGIPFLSHRNWIYVGDRNTMDMTRLKSFSLYIRVLPRHAHRWKLHLIYWLRWTKLGSFYVLVRSKFKGTSESVT